MAQYRVDWHVNPRVALRDVPQLTALPTATTAGPLTDSGLETIFLGTTANYPLGVSAIYQNSGDTDKPAKAYDVRGCRAFSVQLSSYNISAGATVQLLVGNDSAGYSPLYLFNPAGGTYTSSFAIPTGGTRAAPNSTLLVVDKPWFAWMQVSVTAADSSTTANAILSILRRA